MSLYAADISGTAAGWAVSGEKTAAGIRYMPEFSAGYPLGGSARADMDFSLNIYSDDEESDVELYRSWIRYSSGQFEARAGLQKINFGPARIFRPLMWFDSVDIRDPLEFTGGVYGLLGRYYFLNNANIWAWMLYGNDELRGMERYISDKNKAEFGGRIQLPVPGGEAGLTVHERTIDGAYWEDLTGARLSAGRERRFALDGAWDIGIGILSEAVASELDTGTGGSMWDKFLTLGADYTLPAGPGVHVLYEHMFTASGTEFSGSGNTREYSALMTDFSVTLLDTVRAIGYYDWDSEDVYAYLGIERAYDNWMVNLSGFSGPGDRGSVYDGDGIMLMLTFNH